VIAVHSEQSGQDLKEFHHNAKTSSFPMAAPAPGTGPQIGAEYFFREVAKG